jgi:hypothetical protein
VRNEITTSVYYCLADNTITTRQIFQLLQDAWVQYGRKRFVRSVRKPEDLCKRMTSR